MKFLPDSKMAKHTRQSNELNRLQVELDETKQELGHEKQKYNALRDSMRKVRKEGNEFRRQLRDLQTVSARQRKDYAELLSL